MRSDAVAVLALAVGFSVLASDASAQKPDAATQLSKATQNPVGDLISIPLQYNYYTGGGLDRTQFNLNVQPVVPFALGKKWSLIARTIVPFYTTPIPDGQWATGVGDIQQQAFWTPAKPGKFIWGIGPIFSFPTAINRAARTGDWGLGPTAVGLTNKGPWVLGVLVSQIWTIAHDDQTGGADLNVLTMQPFINYNLPDGWAISTSPIIGANWSAPSGDEWTLPLGAGVTKIAMIGKQSMSLGIQYYYNAIHPSTAGRSQLRFVTSFLFPKTPPR